MTSPRIHGGWRKLLPKRTLTRLSLAIAAFCLSVVTLVHAVHGIGLFELDQNAVDGGATGDDANQIYCAKFPAAPGCAGVAYPGALVFNFVRDKVGGGDDIFTGGGSKDSRDVSAWAFTLGEPADKNDIGSVFVSVYQTDGTGPQGQDEFVLYFGLDKFSNDGAAAIGFWFLQNLVAPSGGSFADTHENGDVLVQADLTIGGTIGRFDVYTWGANGFLNEQVAPSQGDLRRAIKGADCAVAAANSAACAVINTMTETAPWPYIYKGAGQTGSFPAATYFEAGLNLSRLFPKGIPCLKSFVAETRQSPSETAQLDDMVYGTFDLCGFEVTKTGPQISKVGDTANYTITIYNNGALPITRESIIDSRQGDLTSQCSVTLNPGQSCIIQYSYQVKSGDPDPLDNTVTVKYKFGSETITKTDSHSVNLFQPSVTLDKKANNSNGPISVKQGDSVNYSILVSNTSSPDTPALNCTVTDAKLNIDPTNTDGDGDVHSIDLVLAPNASETVTADSGALVTPGNHVNTASVSCSPQGFPNVLTASDSVTVTVIQRTVKLAVVKSGETHSKVGDPVNYVITISNLDPDLGIALTSIVDNRIGDLTNGQHSAITFSNCPATPSLLAAQQSCTINVSRTTLVTDSDPFVNTVTVTAKDTFNNSATESDSHSVDLVSPGLTVSKSCLTQSVKPGQSANFQIDVQNTGNVDLLVDISDPMLNIDLQDQVIGAGQTRTIEGSVIAGNTDITNTVTVHATLPAQLGLPNTIDKTATSTCTAETPPIGDATRTLGFWKSHGSDDTGAGSPVEQGYTCHVARDHVLFPIYLGWKDKSLMSCEAVFGVFWSNMGKQSNGGKRDQLCKTSLHASWQLLAAILNDGLTNGQVVPTDTVTGLSLITAMQNALKAGNRSEIIRLQGLLDAYNNSGDAIAIIDGDGATIPHADPNGSRLVADLTAGDCQ